jgi:type I restriction enzyme S subunit
MWKKEKIGNLLSIQSGFAFPAKQFSANGEIPLIRIRDLKNGHETKIKYSGEYDQSYIVKSGDFLIGMDGEFGCYEWRGKDALLNQRVCKLKDFSKIINPRFLFYGINQHLKEIEENTAYTTVKHISTQKIKEITFPIPPLPEQKRIVAILDEAFEGIDAAIANTLANIAAARELFESYLDRTFSKKGDEWQKRILADICEITSTLVDPKLKKNMNLHHIGAGNIKSKTGNLENVLTATEEKLISGKFLFDRSMVLYSKIRPYLKKVARPNFDGLCSADIYPLKPKPGVDRNFLFFMLLSRNFTEYAITGSDRAGMPKVNRQHLFSFPCTLPSIDEQIKSAMCLDLILKETSQLETLYQQKLTALHELKQSILAKAFRGELTQDEVAA